MNHQLTTMLADHTVSQRDARLRSPATLAEVAHSGASGRGRSHRHATRASFARRWVGHAMARGGHALSHAGERIARDRGATLVIHG